MYNLLQSKGLMPTKPGEVTTPIKDKLTCEVMVQPVGGIVDQSGVPFHTVVGTNDDLGNGDLNARYFDGVDDYIRIAPDLFNQDNGSFEALVNIVDGTDGVRIFSSVATGGSNYAFRTYSSASRYLSFYMANGSSTFQVTCDGGAYGEWRHFNYTWEYVSGENKTYIKGYTDGELQDEVSFTGKNPIPLAMFLGVWGSSYGKFYLALFRLYTKTLTAEEVLANVIETKYLTGGLNADLLQREI